MQCSVMFVYKLSRGKTLCIIIQMAHKGTSSLYKSLFVGPNKKVVSGLSVDTGFLMQTRFVLLL